MPPNRRDVQSMVAALYTVSAGLERSNRRSEGAGLLRLLQVVDDSDRIRPSEIADLLEVHPSLITRKVRELELAGYLQVTGNPADRRSFLVTLTTAGSDELRRLEQLRLDRFGTLLAGWKPAEVRAFTDLLVKFEASKTAVARRSAPSTT